MKLTVAIPTYKRPALLARCIESILASAAETPIEILVLDDSTDDTNESVYQALSERTSRVRVIRNADNLGIDGNICACIEHARTEYIWLIGEDDLMRLTGVPTVMQRLDAMPQVPFVYVNYSYITSDQRREFRHESIEVQASAMDFTEFFESYLWSAGFIGGCVIRQADFLSTRYRDFLGTYYAHVAGICLSSLGKRIGIVACPQIGNRVGDASTFTWSDDSFGVFQGWRELLDRMRGTVGETAYQRAYDSHIAAHGYLSYKFLLTKKADGLLDAPAVDALLAQPLSAAEKRRVMWVGKLLPRAFCAAIRSVYARARRTQLAPFSLQ